MEIERLVGYFHSYSIMMNKTSFEGFMPDESDRVFYEVSLSREDSFLVTGNLKHFPVSPKIVSPSEFIQIVGF